MRATDLFVIHATQATSGESADHEQRGVTSERGQSFLTADHLAHIVQAYEQFKDESGFARLEEIRSKGCNLSLPLYVRAENDNGVISAHMADHRDLA